MMVFLLIIPKSNHILIYKHCRYYGLVFRKVSIYKYFFVIFIVKQF